MLFRGNCVIRLVSLCSHFLHLRTKLEQDLKSKEAKLLIVNNALLNVLLSTKI